jgi:hypothetical protein
MVDLYTEVASEVHYRTQSSKLHFAYGSKAQADVALASITNTQLWAKHTWHGQIKHASPAEILVLIFFEVFQCQQVETSFDVVIMESGDGFGVSSGQDRSALSNCHFRGFVRRTTLQMGIDQYEYELHHCVVDVRDSWARAITRKIVAGALSCVGDEIEVGDGVRRGSLQGQMLQTTTRYRTYEVQPRLCRTRQDGNTIVIYRTCAMQGR